MTAVNTPSAVSATCAEFGAPFRTELILIRHPEVSIEAGICYGKSNVSLRDPVDRAAHDLSRHLDQHLDRQPDRHIGDRMRLYSSPLDRCASVAAWIAMQWDAPLHIDADLSELDFGDWELRRWDDIERPMIDAWAADIEHGAPHGGESAAAVASRAQRWLARAGHGSPRTIVAFTHAGVIRLLASRLLGESIDESLRRPLGFGSLCRFIDVAAPGAANAAWRLDAWNVRGELPA